MIGIDMSPEWYLVHPGAGVIPLKDLTAPPPLVESAQPDWWVDQADDVQEAGLEELWLNLIKAVLPDGASSVDVRASFPFADEVSGLEGQMRKIKGTQYEGRAWRAAALGQLVQTNPESVTITQGGVVVITLHDNWDGVAALLDADQVQLLSSVVENIRANVGR